MKKALLFVLALIAILPIALQAQNPPPLVSSCSITAGVSGTEEVCEWRDGNSQLWRRLSVTTSMETLEAISGTISDTISISTRFMSQDEVFYESGQLESLEYLESLQHVEYREAGSDVDVAEDYTALVVQYYENGQLRFRGPPSPLTGNSWDTANTGAFETYYENGQLRVKGTMKEGDWDGPYESYYPSGGVKDKGMYTAGLLCGDWITQGEVELPVDLGSCPPGGN